MFSCNRMLVVGLSVAILLLGGCEGKRRPHPDQFRYPIGVFIQARQSDFWQAVEAGLRRRLNMANVALKVQYFSEGERERVAKEMAEGEWRAVALCAPPSDWTTQAIQQVMGNGIPLICLATDVPDAVRMGFVGTYYYDAGRKAGAWYARRVARGVVVVIAGHPVPRASSEFWEGFRHGLLFNRQVRARLVSLTDSGQAWQAFQRVRRDPAVQGILLMGGEVAQQVLENWGDQPPPQRLGVFSWRKEMESAYLHGWCDLLFIEQPEQIGERLGNMLRDSSAGRGKFQQVFVPYQRWAR
jgi:ABC-type sugar transport system substrate-binding protein